MTVKEIKAALADHPHIKKVWVKDEGYYTCPIKGGVMVSLNEPETETAEAVETITQFKSKKQRNGTK